jgi:hypothetical protein
MAVALQSRQPFVGYMGKGKKEERPLGAYAALVGAYSLSLGGFLRWAMRHSGRIPRRIDFRDLLLLGAATQTLSRLAATDAVTSPFRAPFVEYQGTTSSGELDEKPRGRGLRRALGELVSCRYCLAPWISGLLLAAFARRPRETRLGAAVFASAGIADALHQAYSWLQTSARLAQEHAEDAERGQPKAGKGRKGEARA